MEMVWCNSCSTVVWAYDHQRSCDLRGIVNEMGLPCPNCHRTHCFDGWGTNSIDKLHERHPEVFDGWSAMKFIAKENNMEWKPSPDNRWVIGAHEGLRQRVVEWKAEHGLISNPLTRAKLEGKIEAYLWLLGGK